MSRKKRTFVIVFICGIFGFLASAALEGRWPNFSLWSFLVFVGGLVAMSLAFIRFQSRKDH